MKLEKKTKYAFLAIQKSSSLEAKQKPAHHISMKSIFQRIITKLNQLKSSLSYRCKKHISENYKCMDLKT